jgi:hypothetical protein
MSISEKLNKLIQIKNNLQSVLIAKGLITDTTSLADYPAAISKLGVEVPTIRLKIVFDNQYYVNTTVGNRSYYASGSETHKQGILKVNGVDYYSEILGKNVIIDNTQYDQYIYVDVPQNSTVTIEARLLTGNSSTNPVNRRHLTTDTKYKPDPDVFTFKVYQSNKTVTYPTKSILAIRIS